MWVRRVPVAPAAIVLDRRATRDRARQAVVDCAHHRTTGSPVLAACRTRGAHFPCRAGAYVGDHAGPGSVREARGAVRMAGGVVALVVAPIHDREIGRGKRWPSKGAALGRRLTSAQISSVCLSRLSRFVGETRSSKIVPATIERPRAVKSAAAHSDVAQADSALLRAQFGKGEPAAPASPSRGPGNGILRAETGGLFQAQNAGEQSEFGSQTTLRLTNPPELRGFLSTRKPPRFVVGYRN